jgi:transglutaminase-like putative cysteine protease
VSPDRVTAPRDALQLLASWLGAIAVARLLSDTGSARVLWPLLCTAFIGWVIPAVGLRLRLRPAAVVVLGTLGVVVAASWTAVPGTTAGPSGAAHALANALRAARPELRAFDVPLHPVHGVLFVAAVVVGLVALFQRLALTSLLQGGAPTLPLASLAGTLGLVTWSVAARPGTGAVVMIAAFGVLAFLCAASGPTVETGAAPPPSRLGSAVVATMAVAVAVTVAALPVASPASGVALVPPTGVSLTAHLVDLEANDPNLVLFTARSAVPTYWQVAVLNEYSGGAFVAGAAVTTALAGHSALAGSVPVVPSDAGRAFSSSVSIAHLSSRLLPVPPSAVAVRATPPAVLTPGGVATARPTTPGETYDVLSSGIVPLNTLAASSSAPGGLTAAQLAPDLQLPTLPPVVHALAVQASAAGSSVLTRAVALVDWLRSGRFHYTLAPSPPPGGDNALVAFLTVTRSGNCEQFAGAFTVLARSLGIPTRLVVGFSAGQRSNGVTVVRGRDAHAWPEVYLGPRAGWVSFEPTPSQATGEQSPQGVVQATPLVAPPASGAGHPTVTTSPVTTAAPTTAVAPTTPTTAPSPSAPTTAAPTTQAPRSATATDPAWWAVPVLVAAGVVAAFWLRRRRRHAGDPLVRVALSWRSVDRSLRRAGAPRPPGSSPLVHAARLGGDGAGDDQLDALVADMVHLARMVERAGYGSDPVSADDATAAEAAAGRVRHALRSGHLRQLLRVRGSARADQTANRVG